MKRDMQIASKPKRGEFMDGSCAYDMDDTNLRDSDPASQPNRIPSKLSRIPKLWPTFLDVRYKSSPGQTL
ncbi:hypothetical protein GL2_41150 [Microbulbifer sp. GL-2]|nr:hypothetical protein GL2_41150 [Microbulbifer sp. GL-2]